MTQELDPPIVPDLDLPSLYLGGAFAFVFNARGEILILRENSRARKYEWDLPGGTLVREEQPLDALYREVYEETGLTVKLLHPACLLKHDRHESGYPILVAFYLAETTSDKVALSAEHVACRWISHEQLLAEKIPLPPSDAMVSDVFRLYDSVCSHG